MINWYDKYVLWKLYMDRLPLNILAPTMYQMSCKNDHDKYNVYLCEKINLHNTITHDDE